IWTVRMPPVVRPSMAEQVQLLCLLNNQRRADVLREPSSAFGLRCPYFRRERSTKSARAGTLRNCQRTFNPTIPSARLEKPDTNCRSAAKRGEQIPNTKLYAVTAYQTGTCVAIYYSIDERREEIHLQEIHRLRIR